MNLETEKDDCVQSIIVGATRTADWRDKMLEKYGDQRNAKASKALRNIAVDAENLDDESWSMLQPYFDSDEWREGVSEAARRVGFAHQSKSLPFFLKLSLPCCPTGWPRKMAKIDSAVAESVVEPEAALENVRGERGARLINSGWKGDFVADATAAAFQYGLLVSARNLPQDRALYLLRWHFDHRKVVESYWSAVYQSFLCGRDSGMTHAELRERMEPLAANDSLRFEPTVFEWEDPTTIPVRDWIYGKHLIRRHVSATIASGAVGKTSLKIVEALALATGRPLLGVDVPKRCRVWLFIPRFKSKDDLLEEEFSNFVADYKPDEAESIPAIKNYFKAYAASDQIRHIIESGQLTDLATNPVFSTRELRAVPAKYRTLIPEYVKDYVSLNQFVA